MPKLSVCIPVEPGSSPPEYLTKALLENTEADLEVIVAPFGANCDAAEALWQLAADDPRLTILPPAPEHITAAQFWIGTIAAARGDWVTLALPDDMLEPDLPQLVGYVEKTFPNVDALGWNAFNIAPATPRDAKLSVPVPVLHNVTEMDKARMLDAFFQWKEAYQTPKMPFGLYHGVVKRSLVEAILSANAQTSWLTPLPRYEWAARIVLFANGLALSNRPLSAISTAAYRPVPVRSALEGFPFDGSIGVTAAIAEIQARVLAELGSAWSGFNEGFVRACTLDCMLEHDPVAFEQKCHLYRTAMQTMKGGEQLIGQFQPGYHPCLPDDRRRGLHDVVLLVDRFIANARTAQEFYNVIRAMVTPIRVITDPPVVQAERETAKAG